MRELKLRTRAVWSNWHLQVFGIKERPLKYYCCDCKRKLTARSKTLEWRKIPAIQKRCRGCSAKYRGSLHGTNRKIIAGVTNEK